MPIGATNATLAKLMRKYQNTPAHVAALPTARMEKKVAPYLRQEAAQNAGIAAQSMGTASAGQKAQWQHNLRQQELDTYADQNRKASLLGLADLFAVTPLGMYRGYQLDQQAQARADKQAAFQDRMMDLYEKNASRQQALYRQQEDTLAGFKSFLESQWPKE